MRDRRELWVSEVSKLSNPKDVTRFWYREMQLLNDILTSYDLILTDMHSFSDVSHHTINDVRLRREEVQKMWGEAHTNYWEWDKQVECC